LDVLTCPVCGKGYSSDRPRTYVCCGNEIHCDGDADYTVPELSPRGRWIRSVHSVCNNTCPHWVQRPGCNGGCSLSPTKPCDIGYYHRKGEGCFANPQRFPSLEEFTKQQPSGPTILAEWHRPMASKEPFQVLVKSFLRWNCLERLVKSVKRWYPTVEILIADDSWTKMPDELPEPMQRVLQTPGVHWWQLEYDYGLPASRNFVATKATAPFVIQCDDDFVFTYETKVHKMVELMKLDPSIDVACGQVRIDGLNQKNWHGMFRWEPVGEKRKLSIDPPGSFERKGDIWHRQVHLGWNFFATRREFLADNPADPHFKIVGEHMDRFLDWHENGHRVVELANVVVGHLPEKPNDYKPMRERMTYHRHLMRKWRMSQSPGHAARLTPATEQMDVKQAAIDQLRNRPNIVLLTIGHTGSSVVCGMVGKLGWHLADADEEYSESVSVREVNQRKEWGRCSDVLAALGEPWVIKDPRMCEHLDRWVPHLEPYRPTLVWLTRNHDDVVASYKRRGESVSLAHARLARAESNYNAWRWPKLRIAYESVRDAVRLFSR